MSNEENETPELDGMAEVKWGPEEELNWYKKREESLEDRIRTLEDILMEALFPDTDSNLVAHAKRELELAQMLNAEPDEETSESLNGYNNMMGEAVLELVKVFSKQGHSGFSAGMTLQMFERVASFGTLSPNDHSLYHDVSEYYGKDVVPGTHLQDSRDSKWFSDDGGETWYNVDDKINVGEA